MKYLHSRKTVGLHIRAYQEDKKKFMDIAYQIRRDYGKKITEADLFKEMVNFLEKNKDVIVKRILMRGV